MKLWTWQTSGFDICRDQLDLDKSYYHDNVDGIPEKYKLVHDRLKTKDVVWCFTVEKGWAANGTTVNNRVRWVLEAPTADVLAFVDDWLADRLLNNKPCPEIATWRYWRREAAQLHPRRPDRQNQFIDATLNRHSGSILQARDGWRGFFLEEPEIAEGVSALLRSPIDSRWVIEHPGVAFR